MLELNRFREDKERIIAGLKIRNYSDDNLKIVDIVIDKDTIRRSLQTSINEAQSLINQSSKEIGDLFKQGKSDEAGAMRQKVSEMKENIKDKEDLLKKTEQELEELLLGIPNIPNELVPAGTSEENNEIVKPWEADLPKLPEDALPHWELASKFNVFDLKLGVKITGSNRYR